MADAVVVYRVLRRANVANEIVVKARPPLPAIGKITGLGPGLTRIRDAMTEVRMEHDGLVDDLHVYNMAVGAVRDHVRELHADLGFEVSSGGNGAGGQVSREQLEKRVEELVGGGEKQTVTAEEVGDAAPLTADPATAPGSEH